MRELGDADPKMLARLERVVGAPSFLRLILANGTLVELFTVLQYSTPGFRSAMLDQMTSELAEALIDKTVAAGRSIGTFHLAMRALGDADPAMLARLERVVGAPSFLRLILANGTLFELFTVLQYSTPGFRSAMLDQMTSELAEALIDKTVAAGRSIGTLELAIRELRDADPKMLARLERIVGAPGFLRLLLANGTLVEFLGVLSRATPEFRTALLDQGTSEQAALLIDKTIAEGQRIENFHFALRSGGAKLEDLLGVEGWWKLLIRCGSLNAVSQIIQASTSAFQARMIAAAIELSAEDWADIINRGLFLNACNFVTNDLSSYPTAAREAFRAALKLAATPLAAKATWFDLNPSRPPDEPIVEGTILREALRARIQAVQLTELFELDFREAVNAFALCWRERPDLRLELAANLRKILPPRETWPREKGEVAGVRLILGLSRSPEFPKAELRWLVTEISAFLDRDVCEGIHTLPLFLLVWNICASFYDRGLAHKFGDPVTDTELELVLSVLTDRVSAEGQDPERLNQLALGGLLAISFPQLRSRITKLLAPLKEATRWLVALAMDQTFLPALFALEGMALNTDRKTVFSRERCAELLRKFEEYEDVGPAMNALRNHVSAKHKRQQS